MDWLEYHEEPVTLHSGATSHWLVRGDLIFASPLRQVVLDYWVTCLKHTNPRWVLGVPTGGTPWAIELAKRIEATFVEADGEVPLEGEVVVVDDVVTTGDSLHSFRPDIITRVALAVVVRGKGSVGATWARLPLPMTPATAPGGER